MIKLSEWAVESRYPTDIPLPNDEDALNSISWARGNLYVIENAIRNDAAEE